MITLCYEEGWTGLFTRNEVLGAWRNGTRIVKVAKDEGDANPVGVTGTVLGSLAHPREGLCYFIEWDGRPRMAVACIAWKIEPVKVQ
jgi:hypothetical protein